MPKPPSPEEVAKNLDALEDLIKAVKKAVETGEEIADTIDELDELQARIEAIREDPELQNGEAYAELFVDIAMLIPDNMPIPPAVKEALRAALTLLGKFFGWYVDLAYGNRWREFKKKIKAGFPADEAAKLTGATMAVQAYLIWRYREEQSDALEAKKKTKKVVQRTVRAATFGTATAVLLAVGTQMVTSNDTSGAPNEQAVSVEQPAPVGPAQDESAVVTPGVDAIDTDPSTPVAEIETAITPHVSAGGDPTPMIEMGQPAVSVQEPVVDTSVFVGTHTYGAQFQNPAGDCGWGAFDDSILIDLLVGGSAQLRQAQHLLLGGWSVAAEHILLRLALDSATPETYELASSDDGETFTGTSTYQDSSGCVTTYEVTAQRASYEPRIAPDSADSAGEGAFTTDVAETPATAETSNNVTTDVTEEPVTVDVTSDEAAAEAGELADDAAEAPVTVDVASDEAAAETGELTDEPSVTPEAELRTDAVPVDEAGGEQPPTDATGESASDSSAVDTRVGG